MFLFYFSRARKRGSKLVRCRSWWRGCRPSSGTTRGRSRRPRRLPPSTSPSSGKHRSDSQTHIRVEWLLKKNKRANCCRAPILKFHFEMLLFKSLGKHRWEYTLVRPKGALLQALFHPMQTINQSIYKQLFSLAQCCRGGKKRRLWLLLLLQLWFI